jgi:phage shock protein A
MVDEASKTVSNMRRARNGLQQQLEDIRPEQHEAGHRDNEAQQNAAVDEAQGSGNLRNSPTNKP